MTRYALRGSTSGELLSYGGAVLYHDNPKELEYLFEKSLSIGALKIVKLGRSLPMGQKVLPLKEHPGMSDVQFPIDKSEFKRTTAQP